MENLFLIGLLKVEEHSLFWEERSLAKCFGSRDEFGSCLAYQVVLAGLFRMT